VLGRLGDRRGRKSALVLATLLMAAGTVGIGVIQDYGTAGVLAPILLETVAYDVAGPLRKVSRSVPSPG
jgi:MFS family permease